MTALFAALLAVHGLIHLLGAVKGFGLAALPQLTRPISPLFGGLWLMAAVLFPVAAVSLFLWPRWWWAVATCAIVLSVVALVPSWPDARFGALINVIAAIGVLFGFMSQGPSSLRAEFERDVDSRLTVPSQPAPITEQDLLPLPPAVQGYLRKAGVVGQPRVSNYRIQLHGRIRSGPESPWMPMQAEQYNVVNTPARLFYLTATMSGVPVQGYHRYAGGEASMRVKAAALLPVVNAAGAEMTRSETVTLFNDMCLFAPATLIEPTISWLESDARTVRARFTHAGHSIEAELLFNHAGDLVNFTSDDRSELATDGTARRVPWSTPVSGYGQFGAARVVSGGQGTWQEPGREYVYIELTVDSVAFNLSSR